MKPRTRYLVPTGTKQISSKQYDQKTLPDMRVPGSPLDNMNQFKQTKPYDSEQRKKNHKHFPLKNGLPYVPLAVYAQGAINLFDPDKPHLTFARANIKQPYDSLLKQHRLGAFVKVVDKLKFQVKQNEKNDKISYIGNDDIGLQEKYFLEDRPHATLKHRAHNIKHGHVKVNRFESNARAFEEAKLKKIEEALEGLKKKEEE